MGDVVSDLVAQPVFTISLAALAFAIYFTLLAITTLLFRRIGYERALALGLMVSQRNLGLMLAATAGALPPTTWLYFAMTQFPIHLAPYLLMPIARRLDGAGAGLGRRGNRRQGRIGLNQSASPANASHVRCHARPLVTSECRHAARQFPL